SLRTPVTIDSTSEVAFSVSISSSGWPSLTDCCGSTNQRISLISELIVARSGIFMNISIASQSFPRLTSRDRELTVTLHTILTRNLNLNLNLNLTLNLRLGLRLRLRARKSHWN